MPISYLRTKYKFLDNLGRGGQGFVEMHSNIESGEIVAVKMMKINNLKGLQKMLSIQMRVKSIHHENIIKLKEMYYDDYNNYLVIVMEKCECNLREYLKMVNQTGTTLQKRTVMYRAFQNISSAMIEIHFREDPISNRDIKPKNVLAQRSTKMFKLTDFDVPSSRTQMMTVVGTPFYMAPEVQLRQQYTSKADIYSLEVLIYETFAYTYPL